MSNSDQALVRVIGAGVSGLSAAWLLHQAGRSVEIWDAADGPGGLLAPILFHGHPLDKGSHRIHPEAHPLLCKLTHEADWQERPRRGRLVLGGRTMDYPPRPFDFLKGLGPKTVAQMGLHFATRKSAMHGFRRWERDRKQVSATDIGFADFVQRRVGHAAYAQFYAPYVEKVWGLHPNEISQTVAKARVSSTSPWVTLTRSLRRSGDIERVFLYPKRGMQEVIENLQTKLAKGGVSVQYGKRFSVEDLQHLEGPTLMSGHLSDLVPNTGLNHRGLYLLHLAFPRGTFGDVDTFYCPEARFWFGRVSQPARFSSHFDDASDDIICVEIPEGRWGVNKDFLGELEVIQRQLSEAQIIGPNVQIGDAKQTFLPRVYPMYRRGWTEQWRAALNQVAQLNQVFPIGRQGLFLHCNIDQCVHISDELSQHILANKNAAAWIERCDDFLNLRVRD